MLQTFVHYFLHFVAIAGIAYYYDPKKWKKYYLLLLSTMLIDLDHLWANPIFEPGRCSIGFHPLHTVAAILIYIVVAIFIQNKILKIIFIGLLFHIFTDGLDCIWMWFS